MCIQCISQNHLNVLPLIRSQILFNSGIILDQPFDHPLVVFLISHEIVHIHTLIFTTDKIAVNIQMIISKCIHLCDRHNIILHIYIKSLFEHFKSGCTQNFRTVGRRCHHEIFSVKYIQIDLIEIIFFSVFQILIFKIFGLSIIDMLFSVVTDHGICRLFF